LNHTWINVSAVNEEDVKLLQYKTLTARHTRA